MTKIKIDYSYDINGEAKSNSFELESEFNILDIYDDISSLENIPWLIPARERGGERNNLTDVAFAAIQKAGITNIRFSSVILEA